MAKYTRFASDQENNFSSSDSDEEYQELESNGSKGEDEVYGVCSDSDLEGQEENDLPDIRAWGKDKRDYYNTDYVDPDYDGYQAKDAVLASVEEEEAKTLQNQLTEQFDDGDFVLEFGTKPPQLHDKTNEELIETDVTLLSKRQKLQLLWKEAPELFGLLEDLKSKMNLINDLLQPALEKSLKPAPEMTEFVKFYNNFILNYGNNVYMYLLLKSCQVNVQTHPVAKRLLQFRQVLSQIDSYFSENVKVPIEQLLHDDKKNSVEESVKKKTGKKRPIPLQQETKGILDKKKKVTIVEQETLMVEEEAVVEDGRRGITYQIAKNKGLTPHRKKEQGNPRVKHRNKYRKAQIRRKGAVREVRKEVKRYGGELSGIKASVVKGIKIKS